MTLLLLNAFSTFSPLFFSSGTVYFIAKTYTQRVSRLWACIAIAVWCFCECCTGIALLAQLHAAAMSEATARTGFLLVLVIPILWLLCSIALIARSVNVALVACSLNFVAHYVFLGTLLQSAGVGAAILIFAGSFWVFWTGCFSASLLLLIRRNSMKRLADATIDYYRVKSMANAYHEKSAAFDAMKRRAQTLV